MVQTIKKGAVLGEYAGLIRVDATKGDVYSLNGHLDITDEKFYLTTSKDMGMSLYSLSLLSTSHSSSFFKLLCSFV